MLESDIIILRKRGFEVAKGWEDKDINLPIRKTKFSAGRADPQPCSDNC